MYTLFDYIKLHYFNYDKIKELEVMSPSGQIDWNKFFLVMYHKHGTELLFPIDYSGVSFFKFFTNFYINKDSSNAYRKKNFIKCCDAFNEKYKNIYSNVTVEAIEKNIDGASENKTDTLASQTILKEQKPNSDIQKIINEPDSNQNTSSNSSEKNEYVYPYTLEA